MLNRTIFLFLLLNLHIGRFSANPCHFNIVIPVYNQPEATQATLESVLKQEYNSWHLTIINDGSNDHKTETLVNRFVSAHHEHASHLTLIHNRNRNGLTHTIYSASLQCCDDSVLLFLLPGQSLATSRTLSLLSELYENPALWAASGNVARKDTPTQPTVEDFPDSVYDASSFRIHSQWCVGLPFTCRAWLLKLIKLRDWVDGGQFFAAAQETYAFPVLEMAGKDHYAFVEDILCIQDTSNRRPVTHKEKDHARRVRAKRAYQFIEGPRSSVKKATLVAYSKDRPLQLYAFLESTFHYIRDNYEVTVIYGSSKAQFARGYQTLRELFPQVTWHAQRSPSDLKPLTLSSIYRSSGDYFLFAVDDIIIKDAIDLDSAMLFLEKTHAHGFYLRMGKHITSCYSALPKGRYTGIPPLLLIAPDCYAWEFSQGDGEWRQICTMDMTLYRKQDIRRALETLHYTTPNEFEANWESFGDFSLLGLCPVASKIVNIPVNLVQNFSKNRNMGSYSPGQLLTKFNDGFKIDIKPFYKIPNQAPHMEHGFNFIKR